MHVAFSNNGDIFILLDENYVVISLIYEYMIILY